MKNTYDILVNFKKNPYEFYEWEEEDNIKHIKKIPSFKVNDKIMLDFIKNDAIVSNDFLKQIDYKTEIFSGKLVKKIKYSCILYSNREVIALLFDDDGLTVGKSKLLFDESDDILKNGYKDNNIEIEYKLFKKNSYNNLLTRKEYQDSYLLLNYIEKIYNKKSIDELNYIYYECFNKKNNDYLKSYEILKENIVNGNLKVINITKSLLKTLKS